MTTTACPHATADYCPAHDYDHVRDRIEASPVFADFSPETRRVIADSAVPVPDGAHRCPAGHPHCDHVACYVDAETFAEWDR